MVCIYCGGSTQVSNSRHQKRVNNVWRRRTCVVCKNTFTTIEKPELASAVMVLQLSGRLEPLEREKILIWVYESCKHRQKPLEDAVSLTDTIIGNIIAALDSNGSIAADRLHSEALLVLERFDPVAATLYGAYFKPST